MRFVGIDSAYRNTGVVVIDHTGALVYRRTFRCNAKCDVRGLLWWRQTINEVVLQGDVVAIEGLSYASVGKSHLLAGAYSLWQMEAVKWGRMLYVVTPARAKKWATGSGVAKKLDMIAWAQGYFQMHEGPVGTEPIVTEHEADALALALVAQTAWAVQDGQHLLMTLPEHRREVLVNDKQNGVIQAEGKSYFRGEYAPD